jgi:hypothetical protein
MKKIFLTALFIAASCGVAAAAPYVVSDDFTAGVVDTCIINLDGTTVEAEPVASGSGERCVYDVSGVSEGSHNITMKTKNVWGETKAVPFDFTKALPPSISNLRLEP